MEPLQLVLASSSPYRRQLLERLKVDFKWQAPDIDERPLQGETPDELVARLARDKAQALADKHPDSLIIGSDQVASCEGEILGKPGTFDKACEQLQYQSGRCVIFHTSVAVLNTRNQQSLVDVDHTRVTFRKLSNQLIQNYLKIEQPFDCAGSFKSEGLGICLFKQVSSHDSTALIGLPLIKLLDLLDRHGYQLLK